MQTKLEILIVLLLVLSNSHGILAQDANLREWSDATGSFKVQAILVQQTGATVTLKKEDGSTITVPINKLSEADRKHLASLPKVSVVPIDALKDLTTDDLQPLDQGRLVILNADPLPALVADGEEQSGYLSYKPLQVVAGETDAYDKISRPFIVDRDAGVFAMSIGRRLAGQPNSQRGRIGRVRYGATSVELLVDVPETLDLLDHHESSGISLAICGKDDLYRGGELLLLQGVGDAAKVQVKLRRSLPGIERPGFKPNVTWATLLDAETAAMQIDDTLCAVNLVKNECLFQIDKMYPGATPAASPGGHYLAIPSSGKVVLVESRSGETLGVVKIDSLLNPIVGFDPSGAILLIGYGNQVSLWSLSEGRMIREITTPAPLGDVIGWVDRNLILTSLAGLIDTELEMPIWHYSLPLGKLTSMQSGIIVGDTSDSTMVIRTLPIPHPSVKQMQKLVTRPGALLAEPGCSVAIQVQTVAGVDQAQVRAGVEKAVARAGWKIDQAAKIQLVANIGRGDKRDVQITDLGNSLSTGGKTETVSITPFTATLEIRSDERVQWSRSTINSVPPSMILSVGQTQQDAVSKFERPDTEFFARMTIPPRIVNPELLKSSSGSSRLTSGQWNDN